MQSIRQVAVIGAGVMGAGIAAQIANAGVPVHLLDIVPPNATQRNQLAITAIEKLLKSEPAAFMSTAAAKFVSPGNLEDDLGVLAECDWIIEAIVEKLEIKQALYRKIDTVRRPGTAISSNTSTIPLHALIEGSSESFVRDFSITHFFNPPRYMRLLELVVGERTDNALVERIADFADRLLGKSVVRCKDTPGFIANRLGVYWLQMGVTEAMATGISVEDADAIIGRPMGIPKTGIFGLIDLVGLDLMPHINGSLAKSLPADDAFHAANVKIPLVEKMIAGGYIGRKGKGGFYRLNRTDGGKRKEVIDLKTGEYRAEHKSELVDPSAGKDLCALLAADTPAGHYAWRVLASTLCYAARLVPEAAEDITAIDEAMRLGYNWQWGPFELLDKLGVSWVIERLRTDGTSIPPLLESAAGKTFYRVREGRKEFLGVDATYHPVTRAEGILLLEDIKLRSPPLLKNASAAVWDVGDGVVCFEFSSKSNSLDDQIIALLGETVALVRQKFKALVIYNEGRNFSVGANLGLALFAANIAAWGEIEKLLSTGQQAYLALKYAPFPVVGAPSGMALGGGCEILLHSDAIQAHAETYMGLVECGVGVVPAWGGCKEMLARWGSNPMLPRGPVPAAAKVFETVSTATVSKSAANARELGFLRPSDGITMNRNRLLADAKAAALARVANYQPPQPPEFRLPGAAGKLAFTLAAQGFHRRGLATDYDLAVSAELAEVLTGAEADPTDTLTEARLLELERASFMRLVKSEGTLARIEHTLVTGKPLRN